MFGRLHFYLEHQHGYRHEDGVRVALFALEAGGQKYCVTLPFLSSVLASMRDEQHKYWISQGLALVALIISLAALAVSIWEP